VKDSWEDILLWEGVVIEWMNCLNFYFLFECIYLLMLTVAFV
jgi:hypothetical protein